MKMNAVKLTRQSITYFFSHKQPTLMALLGLCTALFFIFGVENNLYLGFGEDYLYEIPHIFFRLLWQFWVIGLVFVDMGYKKGSFFKVGVQAFTQACSAWWLVAWLIFLQWASIPLIRQPYFYSESVDLSLYILLKIVVALQMLLNFFILPMVVAGKISPKKLLVNATNALIKNIVNIIAFFGFFVFVWLAVFAINGMAIDFMRRAIEIVDQKFFAVEIFRSLWVYSTGYFIFAFLCVAQALYYLDSKKISKKIN